VLVVEDVACLLTHFTRDVDAGQMRWLLVCSSAFSLPVQQMIENFSERLSVLMICHHH
jgi:hypothetical protein